MQNFFSRRQFALGAASVALASRAWSSPLHDERGSRWVLLGTDKGEGIYRAAWNAATGMIGSLQLAAAAERPDFFVRHPHLPVLYTVNESDGAKGAVSSYRVDELTGGLKLLNKVDSEGAGPCALGIDPHGRTLCVADYAGGAFAAFPLSADGSIGAAGSTLRCKDNAACGTVGPVSDRQDMAHLHCAVFSPDGGFVLVCDLGDDAIEVLPVVAPGRTGMAQRVQARRGSGPRHIAFHPSGKWFYCIHELDCTIDIYDWKRTKGGANATLREGSSISTLAAGTALKGNTGCELQVSRDGRFVTACTRGVDEITVYAIDRETGTLSEQQRVSSGGTIPRYIALDPSERWLVCTNQGAATTGQGACVTVFARDTGSGRLDAKAQTFAAPTPMFVAWI